MKKYSIRAQNALLADGAVVWVGPVIPEYDGLSLHQIGAHQPGLEPGTRSDGAGNGFQGKHSTQHDRSTSENYLNFQIATACQRQETLHCRTTIFYISDVQF